MKKSFIIVGILFVLAIFVCCGVYIVSGDEYVRTEFHRETKDRLTLVVTQGKPHARFSSGHGWSETLTIELPLMLVAGKFEADDERIKLHYKSFRNHEIWVAGNKDILGAINIESATENGIFASYDFGVDAFVESNPPTTRRLRAVFQGQSTFYLK